MRGKKLLATFLLGAGLCVMPALGYGEIRQDIVESKVSLIDFYLLQARVSYMMHNATSFLGNTFIFGETSLNINFYYDRDGRVARNLEFPESIDTKDKICVTIRVSEYVTANRPDDFLLDAFKFELITIYSFIKGARYSLSTDMDTDIFATIYTKEGLSAYFYQGEYHLWEE